MPRRRRFVVVGNWGRSSIRKKRGKKRGKKKGTGTIKIKAAGLLTVAFLFLYLHIFLLTKSEQYVIMFSETAIPNMD